MKRKCYKCGEKATKLCDFRNYKKDTIKAIENAHQNYGGVHE